jgi:hypothetical protein
LVREAVVRLAVRLTGAEATEAAGILKRVIGVCLRLFGYLSSSVTGPDVSMSCSRARCRSSSGDRGLTVGGVNTNL